MKVQIHEVTEITRKLDITLPAETVRVALEQAYYAVGRKTSLKGFRPGKVPKEVLQLHCRQDAEEQAIQELVNNSYPKALETVAILPVSYPQIAVRNFKEGEDFTYEATVEIRPTIDPKGYEGLALTKDNPDVSEKELSETLKNLRERAAQLIPPEPARGVARGDVVIFDYEAFQDGKPLAGAKAEGYVAEIGQKSLLPEFEEGLVGMQLSEKKSIDITYPSDWADKNLAGKRMRYEVTLKELKEKKLPELDDDFAKDLGSFNTLDELKERIRTQMGREKETDSKNHLARQIVEKLQEKNKISVPQGMIHMELDLMFHQWLSSMRPEQKPAKGQIEAVQAEFFKRNEEEARLRVIGGLFFDGISRREGIQVAPEEVEKRIEAIAAQSGQPVEDLKKQYHDKNLYPGIEANLREEKTLDFVLSKAKIKINS
ncbi:MAG: trigger factor [Deltaproteobacteria bacterium]|nr:trigger factor [Deltaproteobacteria bacterium]